MPNGDIVLNTNIYKYNQYNMCVIIIVRYYSYDFYKSIIWLYACMKYNVVFCTYYVALWENREIILSWSTC